MKIRDNNLAQVEAELNKLSIEKINMSKLTNIKWSDFLFVQALRRPLIVTMVLQMTQQFSGINAVTFYSSQIFEDAGLQSNAVYASIGLSKLKMCQLISRVLRYKYRLFKL